MIKNENVEGEPAYDETYRRGPVVMRGPMIPKDNTYANLLAPEDSTDWLHADPWRVLRIQAEFVDGFGALAELGRLQSEERDRPRDADPAILAEGGRNRLDAHGADRRRGRRLDRYDRRQSR